MQRSIDEITEFLWGFLPGFLLHSEGKAILLHMFNVTVLNFSIQHNNVGHQGRCS